MVPLTQGLNSGVGLCSVAITYSGCEESRLHVFCWKSGDGRAFIGLAEVYRERRRLSLFAAFNLVLLFKRRLNWRITEENMST